MLDILTALGWRLRRHALEPVLGTTIADVADRLVAFRGWPFDLADLEVRIRQTTPDSGGLDRALEKGEVIRSYAFRGGSYVFTPDVAAVLLACRTTDRRAPRRNPHPATPRGWRVGRRRGQPLQAAVLSPVLADRGSQRPAAAPRGADRRVLGDEVTPITVDGVDAYALTKDLDQLSATEPCDAVRLLPGFDPWVFGPDTGDTRLLAPIRRALATKGTNLVIRGGVVSGT